MQNTPKKALMKYCTDFSRDVLLPGEIRKEASQILEQLISARKLLIIGAVYSLETGIVEFFEDTPDEDVDSC